MPLFARPIALAAISVAALSTFALGASPAWADDKPAANYCWQNADSGLTRCFTAPAALDAAIDTASRSSSAALTTYTLATWYENVSYGGAFTKTTSTNSAACTSGTINLNFAAAWVDRVSSYKTWYGCFGTIFQNTGQGGASFGPDDLAPNVGGLNDAASSYRLT